MNKRANRGKPRVKSSTAQFEQALKSGDTRKFVLRLYVTGLTPRSREAIEQVRRLCEQHLAGRYELEVIDLYKQPQAAQQEQVFASPTLVKRLPQPIRRIVGDMTQERQLLAGLDIRIIPPSQ